MSATQTETIELAVAGQPGRSSSCNRSSEQTVENDSSSGRSTFEAIPDGGYGWVVVTACSTVTFTINGWSGSWGILQTALLQEHVQSGSTTSLSFVGSLSIAMAVALGLFAVRLSHLIGSRNSMLLGVLLMGMGIFLSSFAIHNLAALFVTSGISFGTGTSLTFAMCNSLPVQWFSSRLGLANGLVKLGGGVGATVVAFVVQALIDKVGLAWTFRILGLISLGSGIPAALVIKERAPTSQGPFVDLSLFRNVPYCYLFLAGSIGTFALFVPPFFLPLFAQSIGLSPTTGAAIVASFNACTALGRLSAGFGCDRFGSTNMLLATMALNAISMLTVWPVSSSLGLLLLFAALNGIANGAFFVAMPTAIGRLTGPGQAAVGMSMSITGWTGGYLMGSPIAGILIAATGASKSHEIAPYRAAILYAGGVATASTLCVLIARFKMDSKMNKRL